jgi:hypothetical protein
MTPTPQIWKVRLLHQDGYPLLTCAALLGGSKTTITGLFPRLGHMRRDSSRDSGRFGPRVATSVSSQLGG